ncbi:hypothetical protein Agub_g3687 [Astrephomene gubernaculifera]|uniref:JmjC domain-containing protein n=1 Tax=Astrephomene gubernaculifera TaxID=47775 RepID=A0AAD3DJ16_9CHLO|nr:hypothetical protein Agub_g3687 [Astrephomene gubernaculifera]
MAALIAAPKHTLFLRHGFKALCQNTKTCDSFHSGNAENAKKPALTLHGTCQGTKGGQTSCPPCYLCPHEACREQWSRVGTKTPFCSNACLAAHFKIHHGFDASALVEYLSPEYAALMYADLVDFMNDPAWKGKGTPSKYEEYFNSLMEAIAEKYPNTQQLAGAHDRMSSAVLDELGLPCHTPGPLLPPYTVDDPLSHLRRMVAENTLQAHVHTLRKEVSDVDQAAADSLKQDAVAVATAAAWYLGGREGTLGLMNVPSATSYTNSAGGNTTFTCQTCHSLLNFTAYGVLPAGEASKLKESFPEFYCTRGCLPPRHMDSAKLYRLLEMETCQQAYKLVNWLHVEGMPPYIPSSSTNPYKTTLTQQLPSGQLDRLDPPFDVQTGRPPLVTKDWLTAELGRNHACTGLTSVENCVAAVFAPKNKSYRLVNLNVPSGSSSWLYDIRVAAVNPGDFLGTSSNVNLRDSTLVLCGAKGTGTACHMDRTEAFNVLFAPEREDVDASKPCALWTFVRPSAIGAFGDFLSKHPALPGVDKSAKKDKKDSSVVEWELLAAATLKEKRLSPDGSRNAFHGGPLVDGGSANVFRPFVRDVNELRAALGENNVVVIEQYHGDVVHVPAGWIHQVENVQACLKLAWDTLNPRRLVHYFGVQRLVVHHGLWGYSPEDYMAIEAVLAKAIPEIMRHVQSK